MDKFLKNFCRKHSIKKQTIEIGDYRNKANAQTFGLSNRYDKLVYVYLEHGIFFKPTEYIVTISNDRFQLYEIGTRIKPDDFRIDEYIEYNLVADKKLTKLEKKLKKICPEQSYKVCNNYYHTEYIAQMICDNVLKTSSIVYYSRMAESEDYRNTIGDMSCLINELFSIIKNGSVLDCDELPDNYDRGYIEDDKLII